MWLTVNEKKVIVMTEKLYLIVDEDSTSDELKVDLYLVHAPMSSARFVVEGLSSDVTSIHYIPAEDPLNFIETYQTSTIVIKDAVGNTDEQTYDRFASFDVDPAMSFPFNMASIHSFKITLPPLGDKT